MLLLFWLGKTIWPGSIPGDTGSLGNVAAWAVWQPEQCSSLDNVAACAVLQPEQCVSLGILTYRDESKFPEQEIQYNAVLKKYK
jgi:hypothetical protein